MKQFKKLTVAAATIALLAFCTSSHAALVYDLKDTLNYSSSFAQSSATTIGTVTLTQTDANNVDVLVQLAPTVFVDTGNDANQNTFGFNLSTTQPSFPFGIDIYTPPAFAVDSTQNILNNPYGSFQYSIYCPTGHGAGACASVSTLDFSVHNSSGISVNDFVANSGGYFFSADVLYSGKTGIIAATAPATPVPEPESYSMLLAGLGLLGFMARRRKHKDAAA